MANAQSVTDSLTPDTPFSQLTFEDRKHEARAILVRMFMLGMHRDDDPDMLWNRLCDLGGLKQASLLAGGTQWHIPEKFEIILDQHLYAADEGSILAEFQLGQYYAARDPATDLPRDEQSARMWLNRVLASKSVEDDTIFGAAHYKRLALDELAKLDVAPMPASPMAEPVAREERAAPAPAVVTDKPPVLETPTKALADQISRLDAGAARAKRMAERFLIAWIVAGALIAILGYLSSRNVACLPNLYLAPEARAANPLCPTSIPAAIRLSAVIASFGVYVLAAIAAAFLLFKGGQKSIRADPQGTGLPVKMAGMVLTLCALPVAYLCLKFVGNLVLGWLLP